MTVQFKSISYLIQFLMQRLATAVFFLAAIGLTVVTVMAALGVAPWLEFSVSAGGTVYENAGQITQIGLTVLAVLLCFFLPANTRIMALENSHRRFSVGMQDVALAYAAAHSADRDGVFGMSSEFDSVRERLAYLRDHPDLQSLEPQVLELAAQMSQISRELAEVYSEENVSRAREFLRQRQQEVDAFNARLAEAKQVSQDLKYWLHDVELEESVAASQLQRLCDDLYELLPELGQEDIDRTDGNVVEITKKAAE